MKILSCSRITYILNNSIIVKTDSKPVCTKLFEPIIKFVKYQDGNDIMVEIKNTSGMTIYNVIYSDDNLNNDKLISDSLIVNNIPILDNNKNKRILLGSLKEDETIIIKYSVKYPYNKSYPALLYYYYKLDNKSIKIYLSSRYTQIAELSK